jgi:hypothetical protein
VLREDVEDELRPVEHLEIGLARDVAELARESSRSKISTSAPSCIARTITFLELSLSDERATVVLLLHLQHAVHDLEPRGGREPLELVEREPRLLRVLRRDADDDASLDARDLLERLVASVRRASRSLIASRKSSSQP